MANGKVDCNEDDDSDGDDDDCGGVDGADNKKGNQTDIESK